MDIVESRNEDPAATVWYNGRYYRPEEVQQLRAAYQQEIRDQWLKSRQGQMCKELYDKFQEYKAFLEQNEYARWRPDGAKLDFEEHRLFEKALDRMQTHQRDRALRDSQNLEKARQAARCTHLHTNGEQCRAPRVKDRELCHMHARLLEVRTEKLDLPPLEDANSIQVAIMKLQKVVIDGTLDHKQIGYLSNLIKIAAWNVSRTNFGREGGGAD